MKLEEFVKQVKGMRAAQKLYFRSRSKVDLEDAKIWEDLVDSEISAFEKEQMEAAQPELEIY